MLSAHRFIAMLGVLAALLAASAVHARETRTAVFAGGCFWCMEAAFQGVEGVDAVVSGFSGGTVENPTYRQVVYGRTGHLEVVEVTYDPNKVSYQRLLDIYWRNIDPENDRGQFCDVGDSYRTAIFVSTEAERAAAHASKEALLASGRVSKVVTTIRDAAPFYPAGDEHQDFFELNAFRYQRYREGCGQDGRLDQIWGAERDEAKAG